MIKKLEYFAAGLTLLVMSGCWALSVHPLYTEKDLVADPMLVGQWYAPEEQDQLWIFEQAGEQAYRLTIVGDEIETQLKDAVKKKTRLSVTIDPEKDAIFDAHLVKLGKYTFLDFYPEEPDNANELLMSHLIPAHSFARVSIEENILALSFFNPEWLKKGLADGTLAIKHEEGEDVLILTAGTEELQKFILEHVDEAFEPPQELHRLD